MGTITLSADSFQSTIASNDIVLDRLVGVMVWAVPPVRPRLRGRRRRARRHRVRQGGHRGGNRAGTSGGIMSIPTLMAFRDGVLVYSAAGGLAGAGAGGAHRPGAGARHGCRPRPTRLPADRAAS